MNRKKIILLAKKFADEVIKRFGDEIENIILFGSVARGSWMKFEKSSITVLPMVDASKLTEE